MVRRNVWILSIGLVFFVVNMAFGMKKVQVTKQPQQQKKRNLSKSDSANKQNVSKKQDKKPDAVLLESSDGDKQVACSLPQDSVLRKVCASFNKSNKSLPVASNDEYQVYVHNINKFKLMSQSIHDFVLPNIAEKMGQEDVNQDRVIADLEYYCNKMVTEAEQLKTAAVKLLPTGSIQMRSYVEKTIYHLNMIINDFKDTSLKDQASK